MSSDGTAQDLHDDHRRICGTRVDAPPRDRPGTGPTAPQHAGADLVLIDIDASRRSTLAEQIVQAIQRMVEQLELLPETRLPSIRRFAATHGISTCTVVQAYDRLAATGHIQSRLGSGFYVNALARSAEPRDAGGCPATATKVVELMQGATSDFELEHLSGVGWLPPEWLEDCGIDRVIRKIARRGTRSLLTGYSSPRGFEPLRETVGRQMAALGIDAPPEQILLTLGATGGIDLIGRALVRPGDVVLVDDPGYCQAVGDMRALGATIQGVPWTRTGPDLEKLERLAGDLSPKLFITSPIVHHPTGDSIALRTAFGLLQLAERYNFHIVEDDVLGVLHPESPPRLAGLDGLNRVIYVNSFSKVLPPWLRVGYVAGRANLVRDLIELKVHTQAIPSVFEEQIVYEVLVQGQYRKHLARLRANLLNARYRTLRGLESIGLVPRTDDIHGPFVWTRVPGVTDTMQVAEAAVEHGMLLAPGTMFSPDRKPSSQMRFNVGFCQSPGMFRLLETLLNGTAAPGFTTGGGKRTSASARKPRNLMPGPPFRPRESHDPDRYRPERL